MENFCDIASRNELADFLRIPRRKLTYILYIKKVDSCYVSFEIPKKSGGTRQINAPVDDLKAIQRKLAKALYDYKINVCKIRGIYSNISHGFEKKKSIITNAKIHRNKRFVLNIDLENFFGSFHFGRVRGFFIKNQDFLFPTEVATVIAQLTCYQGSLPQGAPTSPIIANLMCQILDSRLLKIAKKYKLDYTRYADDLTFSTNNKNFLEYENKFLLEIKEEIKRAGFNINDQKTRLIFKDSRQTVTGLVVNKKIAVNPTYYRYTKAMAHALYSKGEFTIDGKPGTLAQLEGRFSFINQIDKYNNKLDNNKHGFGFLNRREREYKRFLFYKYFFGNPKPLIVTEGKTDVRYMKSALKNLYKEYPNLILKKADGSFEFKISFLKRTEKLQYFLGICLDGADAMQHIYKYFIDLGERESRCFPNYHGYFYKMGARPAMPVVLLYDNELESQRPLRKFVSEYKLSGERIAGFKENLFLKLQENGNIFLLTNPLIDEEKESEIERLFPDETLSHEIEGKTFCLKNRYDVNRHYGKEKFSQYVTAHYKDIDFSGFKPLFDALNSIISLYANA